MCAPLQASITVQKLTEGAPMYLKLMKLTSGAVPSTNAKITTTQNMRVMGEQRQGYVQSDLGVPKDRVGGPGSHLHREDVLSLPYALHGLRLICMAQEGLPAALVLQHVELTHCLILLMHKAASFMSFTAPRQQGSKICKQDMSSQDTPSQA